MLVWAPSRSGRRGCRARAARSVSRESSPTGSVACLPSTDGGYQRAPANASGIRHVAFAVDDIDAVLACLRARGAELVGELGLYQDSYRLCYVRGPEGIIVELAEQID
ncbi:MAG: VOC family protein [Solirubrobacteraceae bacterium]